MSGIRSGVATKVSSLEPRALYTHCIGHALNLAVKDGIKGTKVMNDTLSKVFKITKLIKKSPKRDAISSKLKDKISECPHGIRILFPTRWTVRAEAFSSIQENYHVVQLTCDVTKDATRDTN